MADSLSDLLVTDDRKETADVINLFLLGFILLGLIVYIIGNIIAKQLRKRAKASSHAVFNEAPSIQTVAEELVSADADRDADEQIEKKSDETVKQFVFPTCCGDDAEIVEWIDKVIVWLYSKHPVSLIIDSWLTAVNARSRLSCAEHGILIDFKDLSYSSHPPVINNLLQNTSANDKVMFSCEIEISHLKFDVLVTQFKEGENKVFPFILNMYQLSGQLNIECDPKDYIFTVKFSKKPEISFDIVTDSIISDSTEGFQLLHSLICEIITETFASAIAYFRFTISSEFPKLEQNYCSESIPKEVIEISKEMKLSVKLVKADNLKDNQATTKPYCVIEMDNPPQRFETQVADDGHNPTWDQAFLFVVNDVSAELLFELYDKQQVSENFLGLGMISIEELLRNPNQQHIMVLESRPFENNHVSGTLTAEFQFLRADPNSSEEAELHSADNKIISESSKTVETNSRTTAGGTVITTTTIKRTAEGKENDGKILTEGNEPLPVTKSANVKAVVFNHKKDINGAEKQGHFDDIVSTNNKHKFAKHDLKHLPTIFKDVNLLDSNIYNTCKPESIIDHNADLALCKEESMHSNHISEHVNNVALSKSNYDDNEQPVATNNNISCNETSIKNASENSSIADKNVYSEVVSSCINPVEENHGVNVSNSSDKNNGAMKENLHETVTNTSNAECLPLLITNNTKISLQETPHITENNILNSKSTSVIVENEKQNEKSRETDPSDDLTNTALKELEKQPKPVAPDKSTLIIHSVQRVKMDRSGKWQEVAEPNNSYSEDAEVSPGSLYKESYSYLSASSPPTPSLERNGIDRSRPTEKKSIIGNLRKKLSFRKPRSKSAEQQKLESESLYSQESSRSSSALRSKLYSKKADTSSLKSGSQYLKFSGSSKSSFSEASGISGASSRTYINENSTLVIEVNENGILKRYLIPTALIYQRKWTKKGIKLHIFNDHVFVAKHLSGSRTCQVCNKFLTRRPGKQGYECRDCQLQCHKSCHVKTTTYCPNSSVSSMEVEYIQDTKSKKPKSV